MRPARKRCSHQRFTPGTLARNQPHKHSWFWIDDSQRSARCRLCTRRHRRRNVCRRRTEISDFHKDLPFTLYQFSNKFRDEMRAEAAYCVREFVMKDGYSFDMDSNAFKQTYDTFRKVYSDIFSAVGLKTHRGWCRQWVHWRRVLSRISQSIQMGRVPLRFLRR